MKIQLTDLSRKEYERFSSVSDTPQDAVRYLREAITLRTFYESLQDLYGCPSANASYPGSCLKERLINAFSEIEPQTGRGTIERRIESWFRNQNLPATRDDLYVIAFALGFDEQKTSYLLGFDNGYGIHYLDGRDLTFSYCLRMNQTGSRRGFLQAEEFYQTLPPVPAPSSCSRQGQPMVRTRLLQNAFAGVSSDEDFYRLYREHLTDFSTFHQKAYEYFIKYLNLLAKPESPAGLEEDSYSIEAIAKTYFLGHMPLGKRRKDCSVLQKIIKKSWPSATSLKNMRARREDVTRKVLMLLYLITGNETGDEDADGEDFEDHWWRLNLILDECGMSLLDIRNPFDWLALYCLRTDVAGTGNDEPSMGSRMDGLLSQLFETL